MVPGRPSFLSENVAKARARREVLRVFLITIGLCAVMSFGSGQTPTEMARFSIVDGSVFAALVLFIRRIVPKIRLSSFALSVLFRSLIYALVFVVNVFLILTTIKGGSSVWDFLLRRRVLLEIALVFFYLMVLVVTGVRGMKRMLGPSAFRNWLRGYYYTPKQEERIFMFLDIRHSTQLAEQLGDLKFSKLVRDFFDDLTSPIVESRAEVSHYIGDEAVLTWWPKDGLPEARCLQCFFRMQAVLQKRRAYYLNEYGLVPEFKAGAHIGNVVATEVGKIKSEIVFHGDVLNTTARVQGACSEAGVDLLITESLAHRLPKEEWLELQPIGGVSLKGKSEKVGLLSASVCSK